MFVKQSMINRSSNPINHNRSASKISKVMSSSLQHLRVFPIMSPSSPKQLGQVVPFQCIVPVGVEMTRAHLRQRKNTRPFTKVLETKSKFSKSGSSPHFGQNPQWKWMFYQQASLSQQVPAENQESEKIRKSKEDFTTRTSWKVLSNISSIQHCLQSNLRVKPISKL